MRIEMDSDSNYQTSRDPTPRDLVDETPKFKEGTT